MPIEPRYPEIKVSGRRLVGHRLIAVTAVFEALQTARVPGDELKRFSREALAGDYLHALATADRWVDVGA